MSPSLKTTDFSRMPSDVVWTELDNLRKANAAMTDALQRIADGMDGIRAPHRMSAASALAKNTLARLPK